MYIGDTIHTMIDTMYIYTNRFVEKVFNDLAQLPSRI